MPLLLQLYPDLPISRRKPDTVSTEFRRQLNVLMDDIRQTNVHYVRCIKPNTKKSCRLFSKYHVTQQLRHAGVVDAIRVSRSAYPSRMSQDSCFCRFQLLKTTCMDLISLLESQLSSEEFEFGKTKVYFKYGVIQVLETRRQEKITRSTSCLVRYLKGYICRQRFNRIRQAVIQLQSNIRCIKVRQRYLILRSCCIRIQSFCRKILACRKYHSLVKIRSVILLQSWIRMIQCRLSFEIKRRSAIEIQNWILSVFSKRSYVKMLKNAKEDAKLQRQIELLKQRLQDEGDKDVVSQLRRENERLKMANRNLKAFNAQLRQEKEQLEQGQDMIRWNQIMKHQQDLERLKAAHVRIKRSYVRLQQTVREPENEPESINHRK